MTAYEPNVVLSTQEYKVVGTRPIRHDGLDKVTGRARYGADVDLPGLLYGALLRSPHAHARLRGIDASRAMTLPGVRAVVTSADFPEVSAGLADQEEGAAVNYGFYSRNVMAREKVLYRGHALAAVAATRRLAMDDLLNFYCPIDPDIVLFRVPPQTSTLLPNPQMMTVPSPEKCPKCGISYHKYECISEELRGIRVSNED